MGGGGTGQIRESESNGEGILYWRDMSGVLRKLYQVSPLLLLAFTTFVLSWQQCLYVEKGMFTEEPRSNVAQAAEWIAAPTCWSKEVIPSVMAGFLERIPAVKKPNIPVLDKVLARLPAAPHIGFANPWLVFLVLVLGIIAGGLLFDLVIAKHVNYRPVRRSARLAYSYRRGNY